ncbi:hypothetical protein C8R43DRAFT_1244338 [Mycena crocata]|nr:hypothetical protein C8R43DRAFT_1244338 [Mycena crocata]
MAVLSKSPRDVVTDSTTTTCTSIPLLARFTDELILEIFEHLTNDELLPLATISKHIHSLALLSHLRRHGITESDIAANSYPPLSTSGAFPAFLIARFVTRLDSLKLRFDPSTKLDRHVSALATLVQRLPPIKSIDLEFCSWPARAQMNAARRCDMEGLLLTLISGYRSRPSVAVSPLSVTIIRPHKPSFHAVRRLYSFVRAPSSKKSNPAGAGGLIEEHQIREKLVIFPLLRVGGVIPNISIRAFDAPDVLGTLIVLRASGISDLRFPSNLRLSPAEISAVFARIKLPLLRCVEAAFGAIDPAALHGFFCRHDSLQLLRLRGPPAVTRSAETATPREPLPPDALPQLEHVLGSTPLLAWILASPHPFPELTVVTLELYKSPLAKTHYASALRGIAHRPNLTVVSLQLHGCAPWDAKEFDGPAAPERGLRHVRDLRVTWKALSAVPRNHMIVARWMKLFPSLDQVSLFDHLPMEVLCGLLERECPNVKFVPYKMKGKSK